MKKSDIRYNIFHPKKKKTDPDLKEYNIVLQIDNIETPVFCVEAKNWQEVVNYVFGNIQVIDTEEEDNFWVSKPK